jgi:L-amino acid N-acyltransferase YncA
MAILTKSKLSRIADSKAGYAQKTAMSSIVKCYNPPYTTSTNVYDYIKEHIEDWIEKKRSISEMGTEVIFATIT